MTARIVTAVLGVPTIILLSLLGGRPFFVLVLALSITGLFEYYRLTHVPRLLRCWGYLFATAILLNVFTQGVINYSWLAFTTWIALLLFLVMIGFDCFSFYQAGVALLGVCYIPLFFSYLLSLRSLPQGERITILVFVLTWTVDSAAFLVGSRFGKCHLAPKLSPHKTWAGALAGLLGSVTVALFAASSIGVTLWKAVVMGVAGGIAAMVGDLLESTLKRLAQVKDAGRILPGHGGVLDRFDALLLVAPTIYFILRLWR